MKTPGSPPCAVHGCSAQQDLVSSAGESRRCLRAARGGYHPPAAPSLLPNPAALLQAQQGSLWAQTPNPVAPETLVVPVCSLGDTSDPESHRCDIHSSTCSSEQFQMMLPALGSTSAFAFGFPGFGLGFLLSVFANLKECRSER